MMSELDDFSEPSFTHPLECCDGCNVMQYGSDFIDDYENNSVLNVLTAWVELNKIGISPITENKLIGYLKGCFSELVKNNAEFMQTPNLKAFGAEKEKKDLSAKLLSIIFKQCVAKQWLISDFFTFRFQSDAGYRQTFIHKVSYQM